MLETRLAETALDAAAEYAAFLDDLDGEGAAVTFLGRARSQAPDGNAVTRLYLDHHPRLTVRSLDEIGQDAIARFPVSRVRIVHRCGAVAPGEPIVFVAAAAAHRRAAFDAADYLMDRLKTEAVLWKREERLDGSEWIEPSEADRAALARWSN